MDEKYEEKTIKPICSVFDGDFIPFYVCHNKKNEPEKTLEDCINSADSVINNINNNIKSSYFIGFLTKGKCFRYDISNSYKSNRKYENLPKYLNEIKQYLQDKYSFTYTEGYEADDLLITFRRKYSQYESILVSPDKDILNIEGIGYNPRKNEFKYTSKEDDLRYFWTSMLVGDSADGIKGCKTVGPIGANNLLSQPNITSYKSIVLDKYCEIYGEYEGIKEFYKNYYLLKIIDNAKLSNIVINKINKVEPISV